MKLSEMPVQDLNRYYEVNGEQFEHFLN